VSGRVYDVVTGLVETVFSARLTRSNRCSHRKVSHETHSTFSYWRISDRSLSVWGELDHTQRRLLEIRTGIPMTDPERRLRYRISVEALEALYSLQPRAYAARSPEPPVL
jgi:hypothetical protein